jgi:hypothetical protein
VDIVITSDMARAAETGRCIAERNRLPIELVASFLWRRRFSHWPR